MRLLALLLAPLLLLPQPRLASSARQQQQQRWKPLPPPERSTECGSEFHDAQSKWLQSDVVVRATWSASDESTPTRSGIYNVTLKVLEQLKPWSRDLTDQRILVGEFNRTETRRQRALERLTCVPCRPQRGKRGFVFFLRRKGGSRQHPEAFRHVFLPIRFKRRLKDKFTRLQCNPMESCPTPPELLQEARKRVKGDQGKGRATLRLVCRARGLPQPKPMWLKDGVRMELRNGIAAQFRNRNRAIITRVILKNAQLSDVGNYTCVFRNVRGTVSSSISVTAEDLNASMGPALPSLTSTSTQSPSYLCDYNNVSYCFHGGTCFISKLTNQPACRCTAEFTGFFCERMNVDHLFLDNSRRGLAQNLASAGVSHLPTALSVTGALLILAVGAVFVVLIIICCLVLKIRRRLDQSNWKANRNDAQREGEV